MACAYGVTPFFCYAISLTVICLGSYVSRLNPIEIDDICKID